jgi:hypothetical protein
VAEKKVGFYICILINKAFGYDYTHLDIGACLKIKCKNLLSRAEALIFAIL